MKKGVVSIIVFLMIFPALAWSQPTTEFRDRPRALTIVQLEMFPDPVREGQRVRFGLTLLNRASKSGRANILIKDRDQVVAEARGFLIRPGENRVDFPDSGYRFDQREHCFEVEVNLEGTGLPVDFAREFCVQRTSGGWSLSQSQPSVGPFVVEDLDMTPDPARPGDELRFRVRLRNRGNPVRANIRLEDKDETVARMENVRLEQGVDEYRFPYTRYTFQKPDQCFAVVVESGRNMYRAEATREFCAKPLGWTLKP